jgi:hypothetical protein
MATDPSHMLTTKTALWAAFGAACAIALARSTGWVPASSISADNPALLAGGIVTLLLMLGATGLELARGRSAAGLRWLALVALVGAVALSGLPLLAAVGGIALVVGLAAPVALVVLALFGRAATPGAFSHLPVADGRTGLFVADRWFGPVQAGALAWVAGAAAGIALAEFSGYGLQHEAGAPIRRARTVQAMRNDGAADPAARVAFAVAGSPAPTGTPVNVLLVDGTGADKVVLFDHEAHKRRNNGDASCSLCHHRNLPLDKGTPCDVCHQRATDPQDTFGHAAHVAELGGNGSCVRCHAAGAAKTRAASTRCDDEACHARGIRKDSVVRARLALPEGVAPSYVDAMHGLCFNCHRVREAEQGAQQPYLSRCTTCHRLVRTGPESFANDTLLQPEVELERLKLEKPWIGRTAERLAAPGAPARGDG